jgi:pyruvate kinase
MYELCQPTGTAGYPYFLFGSQQDQRLNYRSVIVHRAGLAQETTGDGGVSTSSSAETGNSVSALASAAAGRRVKFRELRRTKIVCTIGPPTASYEMIKALADAGMDVARLNFSHGTYEFHKKISDAVDRVNEERFEKARRRWTSHDEAREQSTDSAKSVAVSDAGPLRTESTSSSTDSLNSVSGLEYRNDAKSALYVRIGKMMDSKGAEVRSGEINRAEEIAKRMVEHGLVTSDQVTELVSQNTMLMPAGSSLVLRCTHEAFEKQPEPLEGVAVKGSVLPFAPVVGVSYAGFFEDTAEGDCILVDGGLLELQLERKDADKRDLICRVLDGGELSPRRHLNIRGKTASLPSVTESDWKDIEFAVKELNVDFIALSFVNDAETVHMVREFVTKLGSRAAIISKIESMKGVLNLPAIIEASDGVMVARGDLGSELPLEEVPIVQSFMVRLCRAAGKVVITATEMLESMIEKPIPTRAEASDVAHAVEQGADALMLSGETAKGKYPIRACATMRHIIMRQNEQLIADERARQGLDPIAGFAECCRDVERVSDAMARAAVSLAESLDAAAIIVFTRTGNMPKRLSKLRSRIPIVAATAVSDIQPKLSLLWNVFCVTIEVQDTFEATFQRFKEEVLAENFLRKGDTVVVVQSGMRGIWREQGHHLLRYVVM